MKTVIRDNNDNITHIYWCQYLGVRYYVTQDALVMLQGYDAMDTDLYYSNMDYDDMREDITDVLTLELSVEYLKLRIFRSLGFIQEQDIIKIS